MKKPVIFISHATDDKPRLVPYLQRILERFGDRVSLWIDSPQKVAVGLLADPRITCIEPGEDWFFSIKSGLESASCLMAFWSRAAVDRQRDVLIREIDHARLMRRYVPLSIDSGVPVPAPFGNDQVFDASKFATPEDDGAFERVLDAVQRVLDRHSRVVAAELLPFLVDRWDPVRAISGAVADDWDALRTNPPVAVNPRAFVVPVLPHDAFENLAIRVATKDGPESCGMPFGTDGHWFRVRLNLPSGPIRPADIGARIERDLKSSTQLHEVKAGLAAVAKPVMFNATLQENQLKGGVDRFLANWANFWCGSFPSLGLLGGQDVRVPVVSILFVNMGEKRSWFSSADATKRKIEQFAHGPKECLQARGLQRLAMVSGREARAWSDRSDMTEYGIQNLVTRFIDRCLPNSDDTMPMGKFCDEVERADWYRLILQPQLSGRAAALMEGRRG